MVSLHAALVALALSGAGQLPGVGQAVFYDFYADWCAPCRAMDPTIQELVARGYPVEKVNIDRNPQLAAQYGVQSIPCYVMVVDGREVDRVLGGTTLSRLDRMCKLASTAASPSRSSTVQSSVPLPAVESLPPFSTMIANPPSTNQPLAKSVASRAVQQPLPQLPISQLPISQLPISSPGWAPKSTPDSHLLEASVRLRIEDPEGRSCGSGTIIDARQGEALILTCAHIFRDSQGKGPIAVDLFGANPLKAVPGRLVSYDLKSDIGLVAIRVPDQVATVPVAAAGYRTAANDAVVTVGCNNGDRPSAQHSRVTVLNKFLGPDSLMVAGEPVEGRSGGGLFSADGRVIGVCNAADREDREGLYAALASIHAELDRSGLTCIYNPTSDATAIAANDQFPKAAMVVVNPPPMARQMPRVSELPALASNFPVRQVSVSSDEVFPQGTLPLSAMEQAALEEIRRKLHEGAEVVCIVRSRTDQTARSEVITLDRASPNFLRQLAGEALINDSRQLTSLAVPKRASSNEGAARSPSFGATPPRDGGWQRSSR